MNLQSTRLIPVPAWPKYHPWPSVAGLRYLIFHAKENGFESCLRRIGRRVLVDERAFFQWSAGRADVSVAGDMSKVHYG